MSVWRKTEPGAAVVSEGLPDHVDVPVQDWLYNVRHGFGMATPVAVRRIHRAASASSFTRLTVVV